MLRSYINVMKHSNTPLLASHLSEKWPSISRAWLLYLIYMAKINPIEPFRYRDPVKHSPKSRLTGLVRYLIYTAKISPFEPFRYRDPVKHPPKSRLTGLVLNTKLVAEVFHENTWISVVGGSPRPM